MVGVAQLVERRTVAPNVVGSNPISHPKLTKVRPGHMGYTSGPLAILRKQ